MVQNGPNFTGPCQHCNIEHFWSKTVICEHKWLNICVLYSLYFVITLSVKDQLRLYFKQEPVLPPFEQRQQNIKVKKKFSRASFDKVAKTVFFLGNRWSSKVTTKLLSMLQEEEKLFQLEKLAKRDGLRRGRERIDRKK